MIKLSSPETLATIKKGGKTSITDLDVLEKVRTVRGFKSMKRHFTDAKTPQGTETVKKGRQNGQKT